MYNNEFEFGNEMEFGNEYGYETATYEYSNEAEQNQELHESLEMELAHELLNVSNEQEMNYFLGKMFKSIGRGVRNFANSSVGKALGGALKSVAKTALPIAGSALGGMIGGPAGAMIGGKLAGAASNLFELELEGLSPEDREFEVARAYVRFANEAIQNASRLAQTAPGISPQAITNKAINQAAAEHAPGLLRNGQTAQNGRSGPGSSVGTGGMPTRGTWVRRGNKITLFI